jgi:hypothetical protein
MKNESRYCDTKFVRSESDISYFFDQISNIEIINDKIAQLSLKKIIDERRPNLNACLIIGAYVLGEARIYMHRQLMSLASKPGFELISIDVDGIIFKRPRNVPIPIPMGYAFGSFAREWEEKEIIAACFLAPKCSSILTKDKGTGEICNEIKVSGMNLKYKLAKNALQHIDFERMIDLQLKEKYVKIAVNQIRRKKLRTHQVIAQRTSRFFANRLYAKRYSSHNGSYATCPYGLNLTRTGYVNEIRNFIP